MGVRTDACALDTKRCCRLRASAHVPVQSKDSPSASSTSSQGITVLRRPVKKNLDAQRKQDVDRTGNFEIFPRCYQRCGVSFGRWVSCRQASLAPKGLSTLFNSLPTSTVLSESRLLLPPFPSIIMASAHSSIYGIAYLSSRNTWSGFCRCLRQPFLMGPDALALAVSV